MGGHVHRLSHVDPIAKTAQCANCGEVTIVQSGYYRGKPTWSCRTKRHEKDQAHNRSEAHRTYQRAYYRRTGGVAQRKGWLKRYHLTPEQYDEMLQKQGGVCAGCGNTCSTGQRLCVDHDRSCCPGDTSCGKCVRGLLCRNCNRSVGSAKDNTETLLNLSNYIKEWNRGRDQ